MNAEMEQGLLFEENGSGVTPLEPHNHLLSALHLEGERQALTEVFGSGERTHVALMHFAPRGENVSRTTVSRHAGELKQVVDNRFVYVSAVGTDLKKKVVSDTPNSPPRELIDELFAAYRKRKIRFIPVHDVRDPRRLRKAIKAAVKTDGRGVAFRLRMNGLVFRKPRTPRTVLQKELDELGITAEEVDLILDYEYLDPDRDRDAEHIASQITEMKSVGEWRSVALLATSMPSSLGKDVAEQGTVGPVVRAEIDLWEELRELGHADLVYGDYGVQHPKPPPVKIDAPVEIASIRYTAPGKFLIARGHGLLVREDRVRQYRECCEILKGRPEFSGSDFTSADRLIEDCALGFRSETSRTQWRRAGTVHHLGIVRDELKQRLGEAA